MFKKMNGLLGYSNNSKCAEKRGGQNRGRRAGLVLFSKVRPQLEYWIQFWLYFKRDMFR